MLAPVDTVVNKWCNNMFLSLVAPMTPVVFILTDVTVTESVARIHLWPVEQRNGPIR